MHSNDPAPDDLLILSSQLSSDGDQQTPQKRESVQSSQKRPFSKSPDKILRQVMQNTERAKSRLDQQKPLAQPLRCDTLMQLSVKKLEIQMSSSGDLPRGLPENSQSFPIGDIWKKNLIGHSDSGSNSQASGAIATSTSTKEAQLIAPGSAIVSNICARRAFTRVSPYKENTQTRPYRG